MNIAYKYRIYPNKEQKELILKTFGCTRKVWNLLLNDKIKYYEEHKEMLKREVSYYKKLKEYEYLKEVDSLALANVKKNLDNAYSRFFKKTSGFPKFKKKKNGGSYTTNYVNDNIKLVPNGIILPKLGVVKTKLHRAIRSDGIIKNVTISSKGDKFYISINVEYKYNPIKVDKSTITEDRVIGLDYSSPLFYIDSNGNDANCIHPYREEEEKTKRLHKSLSRKKKGSKNYMKALNKLSKHYEKIQNRRKDFAFKKANELLSLYDVIVLEDLDLRAIAKSLNLGKSTLDNGFGIFRTILNQKAEFLGKHIIYVDKFYPSSKLCHSCGYKNTELTLSTREWTCSNCNTHHNRDINAAINLKQEGLRILFA